MKEDGGMLHRQQVLAYLFGTIVMSVYGSSQQVSLKIILLRIVSFSPPDLCHHWS
jgi:hypothetical protein